MSRTATGVYGGQSAEQRRAERRAQLLEAGLDLIGTQGWSATTVRGVCTRAKLTSRFFYESFTDLDALAVAVFDQVVEEAATKVVEAVAAAPKDDPQAQVHAAIDTFVRVLTDDPRRARITFIEALSSEALLKRRLETASTFSQLIAVQTRATVDSAVTKDPLVDLMARLLTGGLAELLVTWLQEEIEIDREQLIEDCVALFVATAESAVAIARQRNRSTKAS